MTHHHDDHLDAPGHDPATCAEFDHCQRCLAYSAGYTRGKAAAYSELRLRLGTPHAPDCGCLPCRIVGQIQAAYAVKVTRLGHAEDCAGPGCSETCRCTCHAGEPARW